MTLNNERTRNNLLHNRRNNTNNQQAQIYNTPITITSNNNLKYLAIDLAGNKSPIYTQTYTIDKIPPTANANPTGGLYNTTKTVTLTMSEPGTIYYTTNGTNPTTSSTKYSDQSPYSCNNHIEIFSN